MRFCTAHALAAVAALGLLAGCETFVESDPVDYTPVLAVDAVFETGVPWSLAVEATLPIGSDALSVLVDDAVVIVTRDDGLVLTLPHVGQGRYGARYREFGDGAVLSVDDPIFEDGPSPDAGHTYSLTLSAPGYEPVEAVSSTPPLPSSFDLELLGGWTPVGGPNGSATDPEFGVRLEPSAGHYQVFFVSSAPEASEVLRYGTFATDAPVVETATFLDDIQASGIRSFSSAFLVPIGSTGVSFTLVGQRAGARAAGVHIVVASEEFYQAERSRFQRVSAESNPFADPVRPFSNIRGGAGIFAGRTRVRNMLVR